MSAIIPFDFGGEAVRVVSLEGEPWFVATDVAKILGFASAKDFTRGLDDDEKGGHNLPTLGGSQEVTIISEPGLYSAILRSRVEGAKRFKRWLTHDLLPAFRKGQLAPRELSRLELIDIAREAEVGRIEAEAKILELEPKAKTFDSFLSSIGDYSVNEAAKILSRDHSILTGERRLFNFLEVQAWIYRDAKGKPIPYQNQIDTGRLVAKAQFHYHPETGEQIADAPQVRITAKGLDALRAKFLKETA